VTTASELRRAAAACEDALRDYYQADRLLLRLDTAATALDTPRETVRAWIRSGELAAVRVGRAVYVAREDLVAFVERHREAPATPGPRMARANRGRYVGLEREARS
jgi:excisionase family DNA binding protein